MGSSGKKLRVFQLAAVIFLTVSGGPYGLEPLLSYAGKNGSLLLLIITPLLWDIPTIFAVLELNSMMPVTGGYYQWVKRALGLRFGFYEGWWTWLYTFVDLAIYPVLFVEYLSFFFPGIEAYKIPLCLGVIWISAGLNILGIVPVGEASLFLAAIVLLPFAALFVFAFIQYGGSVTFPAISLKGIGFSSIGMGLYTVMWNFIGWDNVTTYAGEVNKPVRSYLISIGIAFLLILSFYFLAIFTAQLSGIDFNTLTEDGFPALGLLIKGQWLGAILSAGGMASALGLFSAVLLSVSRVPKVMADDGLLPAKLHTVHPKFKTPYISIIVCSLIVSFMILWTLADLVIIDVTVYGAGLFLEFLSLVVLRIKAPHEHRPFKIPFNIAGLCIIFLLPVSVFVIALSGAIAESEKTLMPVLFASAALLTAEIVWRIIIWIKPQIKTNIASTKI
ncbi:MAG TPA: APC family permease [Chitinophagaceae bacterium]|jgi:amino acid transporter